MLKFLHNLLGKIRKSGYSIIRPQLVAITIAALFLLSQFGAAAHDIPNDVTIHAFLKPEGQRLHLLVRVPLKACRDVDFPTRGPGYLDITRADKSLHDAATLWISDNIEIYEGDSRLNDPKVIATRVSLESERIFDSFDQGVALVTGPRLPIQTELFWNQALLDVLFEYSINSDSSAFSVHPALSGLGLRVATVLRFIPTNGVVRAFEFEGDPGLVRLDPRWHQAALRQKAVRIIATGMRKEAILRAGPIGDQ